MQRSLFDEPETPPGAVDSIALLSILRDHPHSVTPALAQLAGISHDAAADMVRDLERRGLIVRGEIEYSLEWGAKCIQWEVA